MTARIERYPHSSASTPNGVAYQSPGLWPLIAESYHIRPVTDRAAGRSRFAQGRNSVRMKVREIIKLIEADGWFRIKARGGHRQYKHPTKRGRILPLT